MKKDIKFHEASDKTQKEIIELIVKDNYQPQKDSSKKSDAKDSQDSFLGTLVSANTKEKDAKTFHEASDKTQKEIAELIAKGDYSPLEKSKTKTNADFDLLRIMKIEEFLAEQRRKMSAAPEESKFQQVEREFTSKKDLDFTLGRKEISPIEAKVEKIETTNVPEFKGAEKDIIKKIRENEQKALQDEYVNKVKALQESEKRYN